MPLDLRNRPQTTQRNFPIQRPSSSYQPNKVIELNDNSEHFAGKKIGQILHQWRAPEFEVYEKSGRWYLIASLFLIFMIAYGLYDNDPIMSITFILIGIVGYIYAQKDPRVITFAITTEGVIADKELYLYENIHSFWIFYDPPHTKTISLHTKASVLPFVHIPLKNEDPVNMRELLIKEIPEIKQDPSLIDAIERVLHI